jgi:hypothetical protein
MNREKIKMMVYNKVYNSELTADCSPLSFPRRWESRLQNPDNNRLFLSFFRLSAHLHTGERRYLLFGQTKSCLSSLDGRRPQPESHFSVLDAPFYEIFSRGSFLTLSFSTKYFQQQMKCMTALIWWMNSFLCLSVL